MAPSIESLSVDEDKELLILSGQFGVRDGQERVKIDLGPQLELPPWSRSLTNQLGLPTDIRPEFRSDFPPSDADEG